jgi:diacylglycerol kinase family enzyme
VVERANRSKEKGKTGPLLYFYHLLFSLMSYRSIRAVVEIDGRSFKRKIFSLNVGIGKYNGGGMIQVPHAVVDDGLYSITLIRRIGKLNVLVNIKKLYNGTIASHSKVETYMARSVQIAGSSRLTIETDGESLGHGPVSFEIIPRSVRVISGELTA